MTRMADLNWQPIHLAPKNEVIILGDALTHRRAVGWWSPFLRNWTTLVGEGFLGIIVNGDGVPVEDDALVPSHFQRLPEAP